MVLELVSLLMYFQTPSRHETPDDAGRPNQQISNPGVRRKRVGNMSRFDILSPTGLREKHNKESNGMLMVMVICLVWLWCGYLLWHGRCMALTMVCSCYVYGMFMVWLRDGCGMVMVW